MASAVTPFDHEAIPSARTEPGLAALERLRDALGVAELRPTVVGRRRARTAAFPLRCDDGDVLAVPCPTGTLAVPRVRS